MIGIILEIQLLNAISIEDYSPFKNEKELLLSPNMKFLVTSDMNKDEVNSVYIIKLCQQKFDKETFVF